MLVVKAENCKYGGFVKGYHKLIRNNGSVEFVAQFKMVVDPDTVYIYLPDGTSRPTFATERKLKLTGTN